MNRYFFDVAAKTYVQYDYKGRDFERPDQARELAELIALDVDASMATDRLAWRFKCEILAERRCRRPDPRSGIDCGVTADPA
jgi:hypothetical protein